MGWISNDLSTPKLPESLTPLAATRAASFPAFSPIVSEAFEQLKNLPEPVSVARGTLLVEQGQRSDAVYLIRTGMVKLIHATPEGRETTLGLRSAGWYAGAVLVMRDAPSVYTVKAVTRCTVSRIPAAEFASRLMQNARMMRHFMETLCNELITQSAGQAEVMCGSAEERLSHFMTERGAQHQGLRTLDPLPHLKQMELAQLLSITPEHLSRLMHKAEPASETSAGVAQRYSPRRKSA